MRYRAFRNSVDQVKVFPCFVISNPALRTDEKHWTVTFVSRDLRCGTSIVTDSDVRHAIRYDVHAEKSLHISRGNPEDTGCDPGD